MLTSATSSDTSNSFATPATSAVMTDDASATTKHVSATTRVQYHLYARDQFLGLPGSGGLVVKLTRVWEGVLLGSDAEEEEEEERDSLGEGVAGAGTAVEES